MSAKKENLLLLLDRPREPVFMAKGEEKTVFEVPNEYLSDRYKPIGVTLSNRFGSEAKQTIPVRKISIPPLGEILDLPRNANFVLFLENHRRLAGKLIEIFIGVRDVDDLTAVACATRDKVNPYLFNYALSVAILHRPDTKNLDLPSFISTFPDKYVDPKALWQAREEACVVPDDSRIPIEIPIDFTATDLEEEHRVAYFREDLGLNLHHWHWHLVYPSVAPKAVVDKDRRGELFYYMHKQIVARYNFERLSNKLNRVKGFNDFNKGIEEAYFPKLDSSIASRAWPPRVANQKISDLNRTVDHLKLNVVDLKRWGDRIYDAIHSGFIIDEHGHQIHLTEETGIDILGNIIDSSILSKNRPYYGDYHGMGHIFIACIHDPDHRHLESLGVMGDSATAMRDPVFYRWHTYLDEMFQDYKATLPKYTVGRLEHRGVTIEEIEVQAHGSPNNTFNTFWQQSDVDLSRGMDFQPRGPVFVRFTHLQHQPFSYKITIKNQFDNTKGTCRIFLSPKFDEKGNQWLFTEQKNMFIELDKFTINLKHGRNVVTRLSTESSVTIPFERTFRNVDISRPTGGDDLAQFNFCGCGWPQHLLIPKGTLGGMQAQLFVMISDYEDDKIEQTIDGFCNDAGSYCGIKDKLYPDKRSMGYPFDRVQRAGVEHLAQFLTSNMRVQDVIIKFHDKTLRPKQKM